MRKRDIKSFDEFMGVDKKFKEKLPITDRSWGGIGKHIGGIVQKAIERESVPIGEFNAGNIIIPEEHFRDYLSGRSSFGCFFRPVKHYIELGLDEVFDRQSNPNEKDMEGLLNYLESVTYESFIHLLTIKPGKELRSHVSAVLKRARTHIFGGLPESEERDFISRYLTNRKAGETPEQAWGIYQNCLEGKILDDYRLDLVTFLGLHIEEVIPLLPFDKWRESMKFELYCRMQSKGIGPVCGTRVIGSEPSHVDAKNLTDQDHYLISTSLMPHFYLLKALPVLTED